MLLCFIRSVPTLEIISPVEMIFTATLKNCHYTVYMHSNWVSFLPNCFAFLFTVLTFYVGTHYHICITKFICEREKNGNQM